MWMPLNHCPQLIKSGLINGASVIGFSQYNAVQREIYANVHETVSLIRRHFTKLDYGRHIPRAPEGVLRNGLGGD